METFRATSRLFFEDDGQRRRAARASRRLFLSLSLSQLLFRAASFSFVQGETRARPKTRRHHAGERDGREEVARDSPDPGILLTVQVPEAPVMTQPVNLTKEHPRLRDRKQGSHTQRRPSVVFNLVGDAFRNNVTKWRPLSDECARARMRPSPPRSQGID